MGLPQKNGVKNFDSFFFMAKAAMEKFHARQAFRDLTEYSSITKRKTARFHLRAAAPFLTPFVGRRTAPLSCQGKSSGMISVHAFRSDVSFSGK